MGADVAASPHCPFAVVTKPGRRGRPFRAVSKAVPDRGPETVLRSPAGARASTGFPAGSPTRAGGPGGSPIGGSDSLAATVPSPASAGRSRSPRSTEALGRSLGSAWHSHASLRFEGPPFAAPRHEAWSCPTDPRAEARLSTGGSRNLHPGRRTVREPKPSVCLVRIPPPKVWKSWALNEACHLRFC